MLHSGDISYLASISRYLANSGKNFIVNPCSPPYWKSSASNPLTTSSRRSSRRTPSGPTFSRTATSRFDDLKKLLPIELDRAHAELRKFENSAEKDLFYKAYADLCQNIMKMILGPAKEREQLKAMLKQKYGIE